MLFRSLELHATPKGGEKCGQNGGQESPRAIDLKRTVPSLSIRSISGESQFVLQVGSNARRTCGRTDLERFVGRTARDSACGPALSISGKVGIVGGFAVGGTVGGLAVAGLIGGGPAPTESSPAAR